MKFSRRYRLEVFGLDKKKRFIEYPLTCSFTVERHTFSMANTASFSLYGLSADTRKNLVYDATLVDESENRVIEFYAGYDGGVLSRIFHGTIKAAYTTREGPELITHITAQDCADSLGVDSYSGGTEIKWDFKTEMEKVMASMKTAGISVGGRFLFPETSRADR